MILAGISINAIIGDDGLIKKAQESANLSNEADAKETINRAILEFYTSREYATLKDFLETKVKKRTIDSVVENSDGTLTISKNGYTVNSENKTQTTSKNNGSGSGSSTDTKAPATATTETAPYFPDGTFTKKEGTIDTGLVIQDTAGNEYVWVVVPRTSTVYATTGLGKTTFTDEDYASIETDLKNYTSTYRNGTRYSDTWAGDTSNEGWFADEAAYNTAKNNMLKSVYLNGGFYVGRYEAGIGTNRTAYPERNSNGKYDITGMPTPVTKADAYPYTYVTRTQAKNLAEKVNSGDYTSSLMFGVQWDLVLAFMSKDSSKISSDLTELTSDSTSIGNYYDSVFDLNRGKYAQFGQLENEWKNFNEELSQIVVSNTETGKMKKTEQSSSSNSILITTGATEQSKVMNIYDIAGNVWEWTLELTFHSVLSCASRGGGYSNTGSDGPASYRNNNYTYTTNSGNHIGFRVSLW